MEELNRQQMFRPNVAALVRVGDKFLRCLRSKPAGVWQTVQGGIEVSDASAKAALLREIREELGVDANQVTVVAQSKVWRRYVFPPEVLRSHPERNNIGQEQLWFLVELPSVSAIALEKSEGEFIKTELVDIKTLVAQMVSWKLPVVKDFCYEMGLLHPFQG